MDVVAEETGTEAGDTPDISVTVEDMEEVEEIEEVDDFTGSDPVDVTEKPNSSSWVPMIMGDDGSPQVAPGYDGIKPENGQMFDCTEMAEGLFNCTVVEGPTAGKNDSLVTSDIDQIKTHLENTGGVSEAVTGDSQPQPEAPAGTVGTEAPDLTTSTATTTVTSTTTTVTTTTTREASTPETRTTVPTTVSTTEIQEEEEEEEDVEDEEAVTVKPLDKLNYREACGRTPWLNETYRASHASPR